MKYYVFESSYGYNNSIRLGKIYQFTSSESMVYLLEVNHDLIELSHIFRKFSKHVKQYLYIIKAIKIFKVEHLYLVETGQATWRQLLFYNL